MAYDIIILAGQSNAVGTGRGPVTKEYVPNPRVLMMDDDSDPHFVEENGVARLEMKWPAVNSVAVADERVLEGGKRGCFALQFAEKYVQTYLQPGRQVLIVKACFGGTGVARPEWGVGNCMHTRMLAKTKAALEENPDIRVVAILWSQGEHDSFENADWEPEKRYRVHKDNLTATFRDLYAHLGDKKVPLIACGFPDTYCASVPEASAAVLKAIREVIADFGGAYVDTAGLISNSQTFNDWDIYHFSRESLHILGGMLFDAYAALVEAPTAK